MELLDAVRYIWEGLQRLPFEAKAAIGIPTVISVAIWAITELWKGRSRGPTVHGSVIFSDRQMGGQIAHSIVNQGPAPRRLSDATFAALVATLSELLPMEAEIMALFGSAENFELATQIKRVLEEAGWTVGNVTQGISDPVHRGVWLSVREVTPSVQAFGDGLSEAGIEASGERVPELEKLSIIVGPST